MNKTWHIPRPADVPESDAVEIYERFQRQSFNLMLSILAVSSTKEDAVNKVLFEPLIRTTGLWDSIAGTTKEYHLPLQVDRQRVKTFKAFLRTPAEGQQSGGYMASQDLAASSLCEDVNRFDFNQASMSVDGTQRITPASLPSTVGNESSGLWDSFDPFRRCF